MSFFDRLSKHVPFNKNYSKTSEDDLLKELRKIHKDFCIKGRNDIDGSSLGLTEIPEILLDIQGYNIYLQNNHITTLEGFVQNGYARFDKNKIQTLKGHKQNGHNLSVKGNRISDLSGFEQDGNLACQGNLISDLAAFNQNCNIYAAGNRISSLSGFVQKKFIDLRNNKIKTLEGFTPLGKYLEMDHIHFERIPSKEEVRICEENGISFSFIEKSVLSDSL